MRILDNASIEVEMQRIINSQWPPAARERAKRLGGQLLTDLNAFFDTMTTLKASKIAERDLAQAVLDYDQAVIRLAEPELDPADYPDIEGATHPALVIDTAERTAAQTVIINASQAVLDIVAAREA